MHRALFLTVFLATQIFAAEVEPFSDPRPLLVRAGILDLGATYGEFLTCVRDAQFPTDAGPRNVALAVPRKVATVVNDLPFVFHLAPTEEFVLINSITIGSENSARLDDKIGIVMLFFQTCKRE